MKPPSLRGIASRPGRWSVPGLTALLGMVLIASAAADQTAPLTIRGTAVHRFKIGDNDATWMIGNASIQQADQVWQADEILLVSVPDRTRLQHQVVAKKLRGHIDSAPTHWTIESWDYPAVEADRYLGPPSGEVPLSKFLPIVAAADSSRKSGLNPPGAIRRVQYEQPFAVPNYGAPGNLGNVIAPPIAPPPPTVLSDGATTGGSLFVVGDGTKSIEITGRGVSSPPVLSSLQRPETGEDVLVARGGVTITIRDVTLNLPNIGLSQLGTVSISADQVVAWVPPLKNLLTDPSAFASSDGELYLEGDIVFRQGERIIYANSMYYNVARETGMVLDAEAITTVPEYQGVVRLKSEVLQQVARGNYLAFDAAVTTSRMGVPRYWLQSERLQLSDRIVNTTDPITGAPAVVSEPYVESNNNFVYAAGIPVLYWPTLASPLRVPTLYVSGIDIGNDNNFGSQLLLDFNLFQVLGIDNAPRGVEWDLTLGYFSERGPIAGTKLDYTLPGLLGVPGPVVGNFDTWVINDNGLDTLGRDRRDLQPEETFRGRSLLRHRHFLPNDYEFIAELGLVSDRNFLEQYFENEWDREVDHRAALRLHRYFGANRFDLSARFQANDFRTVTEELPDLEHHLIGGSLFDIFTLNMHNRIGYQRLEPATPPDDPAQAAAFIQPSGVVESSGLVASTKREIGLPFSLGALKIVPHLDGGVDYYGEAIDGQDLTRLTAGGGARFNLPMWRADPNVRSSLLNINGLSHKVDFHGEYLFAESDANLDEVPLYDELDDQAQQEFRRRFTFADYGGVLPPQFDRRNYAFRHGYQNRVAPASDSVVDDVNQIRLGIRQAFETKRGLPGRERITDVLKFDVDTILFVDADRDNFGETIGPTTYDAKYFLGDRVALLSDGYFDFFEDGLSSISAGVQTSRPGLGDVYLGLLSLQGPIDSTVLRANTNYRLNEKWIASGSTIYDFGSAGNVGQSFALTRIGESFLVKAGINVDRGRDNVGFQFAIEPRFFPRPKLGRLGGELIPPPGVEGLE